MNKIYFSLSLLFVWIGAAFCAQDASNAYVIASGITAIIFFFFGIEKTEFWD